MKSVLISGAGTAGTAIAHKLRRRLPTGWDVAAVDPSSAHLHQPRPLFSPFGDESEARIVRERHATLSDLLESKGIQVETEFMTGEADSEKKRMTSCLRSKTCARRWTSWT
jgi:NADH dehydrogenase FAD-containing subunit